ncbi:MAG: 30S ribosomal protein S17 [Candidatus Thermoplasmatota archaeon]|jgi:small subunit ribosomal protein S17|nr:30S ribosomal protein S17 [Candidatus Thermoplasmatota archaeon]
MKSGIGLDLPVPKEECHDRKCPFHGEISVRGQVMTATVKSAQMKGSAVVYRTLRKRLPKFERNITKTYSYHVHVPECIPVSPGDTVKIAECRKLAKTVSYVIVQKVNS